MSSATPRGRTRWERFRGARGQVPPRSRGRRSRGGGCSSRENGSFRAAPLRSLDGVGRMPLARSHFANRVAVPHRLRGWKESRSNQSVRSARTKRGGITSNVGSTGSTGHQAAIPGTRRQGPSAIRRHPAASSCKARHSSHATLCSPWTTASPLCRLSL